MTWWHWSLNWTAEVDSSQRFAVIVLNLLSVYYHVKPKLKHFMLSIIQFSRYIICINVSLCQLIKNSSLLSLCWTKCNILDKNHDFYRISTAPSLKMYYKRWNHICGITVILVLLNEAIVDFFLQLSDILNETMSGKFLIIDVTFRYVCCSPSSVSIYLI